MDFPFNVNQILNNKITLITNKDLLYSSASRHQYNAAGPKRNMKTEHHQNLSKVIDIMGMGSAKAQSLRGPITTSFKLKSSEDHLYILKEESGNNDLGSVVGIIRIGVKRLFLADVYGQQHECQPLCVLDFYVHESKQRSGHGLGLFKHMIENENVAPNELAIDRPSPKFVNFLQKHFQLDKPLYQVNKFVVFPSFFNDLGAIGAFDSNRRRSAPVNRNKLLEKHTRPVSRNVSSAKLNSRNAVGDLSTEKSVTQALNSLSGVVALNHTINDTNQATTTTTTTENKTKNNPSLLGLRNLNRPPGGHAQRSQFSSQSSTSTALGTYSRYSVRRESNNSGPLSPLAKPRGNASSQHSVSSDIRNQLSNKNHTVMHGRTQPNRENITSLDNPLVNENSDTKQTASDPKQQKTLQEHQDTSYTIGLIDRMNRQTLGTNWNVFGVPNASVRTSNPYSSNHRMSNFSRR